MKNVLSKFCVLFFTCSAFALTNGTKISLSFKNQKIEDILLSLSNISGKSIVLDDSISGNATFNFSDTDFDTALQRFSEHCHLFTEVKDNIYYVSRIQIIPGTVSNTQTVDAEDVMPVPFLKAMSRKLAITIIYDPLPQTAITIKLQDASIETILKLFTSRYDGYVFSTENGGFFIRKSTKQTGDERTDARFSLTETNGFFSISGNKIQFSNAIDLLFKKGKKEYALLNKNPVTLENFFYENKDFETMLHLILEQANSDYIITNGIYYIFEIQKKDITKKLKTTTVLPLTNISVLDIQNIFPNELNASSFIKIDKTSNTVYITGSTEETSSIISFIKQIDVPLEDRYYKQYSFVNLSVKDALSLIPKTLLIADAIIIPNTSTFITQTTKEKDVELTSFISTIDKCDNSFAVRLKYIKSEVLLKFLPPGTDKDRITVTGDPNVVFFTGSKEQYDQFISRLTTLDQPAEQIKYQLLVIQYQKSDGENTSAGFKLTKTDADAASAITANFTNLFNITFDVVSQFGFQAAGSLDAEISENRAKIIADTTLNGLSGQDITFENKNIYRYRDILTDASNDTTSSVVREISTGLSIKINGWVSGDGMITASITANLSKQGSSDDNSSSTPPSTSEKSITTNICTKSGTPIVISGLLQTENDKTEERVPVLGSIPLLGILFRTTKESISTTEMVIYLVPFVDHSSTTIIQEEKNIRALYEKYVAK